MNKRPILLACFSLLLIGSVVFILIEFLDAIDLSMSDAVDSRPVQDEEDGEQTRMKINRSIFEENVKLRSLEIEQLKNDPDALRDYLSRLKSDAGQHGIVTAADVEAGVMAIQKYEELLGFEKTQELIHEFFDGMRLLSEQLRGSSTLKDNASVETLLDQIETSDSNEKKQKYVREYLDAIASLSPEEQDNAIAQMERVILSESAVADFDNEDTQLELQHRLTEIGDRRISEIERQTAIRQYLDLARRLPPEQFEHATEIMEKQIRHIP